MQSLLFQSENYENDNEHSSSRFNVHNVTACLHSSKDSIGTGKASTTILLTHLLHHPEGVGGITIGRKIQSGNG